MNSGPVARHESGGRQPLLWAALAFAAGIATGVHAWRPPLWWVAAWIVFALAGAYLFRRRGPPAFILGLGALFLLGALMVQVRGRDDTGGSGLLRFADGTEVIVTAHVTKEGTPQEDGPGSIRQRLEVETEQISRGNQSFAVNSGMRINVYQPQLKNESDQPARAARLFRYGERLRFPAKIFAPRNCRNPGAFDYRGYLAENGIVALASAKSSSVEVLPGFVGSRTEFWRARVHRSIIDKVHALWPPREAALMDAMVIGEDAFINRPTRADFQRSGTYHVLVVSGMNVSILALVTFWFLRWLRISDLLAGAITVALMMSYAWLGHPRFAVISVGARNTYGNPRGEVLDRLGQARVLTYRTDRDGAVTFYLDGKAVISGLPRAEVH